MPWSEGARRVLEPVAAALDVALPDPPLSSTCDGLTLWAECGAQDLTGRADGPGLTVAGAPAEVMRDLLAVCSRLFHVDVPGPELLTERARLAGLTRRGPWSVGGGFRTLPTADGWFGLSLARASDIALIPALVSNPVDGDPWDAVAHWLARTDSTVAAERAATLGLPGAAIPSTLVERSRPPVVVTRGGARRASGRAVVVDLTALWAGPLCARLLGLGGAYVIKVESRSRPDGARLGSAAFYERLHRGHSSITLDLPRERSALVDLLGNADVVLESSRPRALRQWGVEAQRYVDAGAIWVGITAAGRDDPHHRVGFGDDVAAGAGLVAWDAGEPLPAADALADPLTGAAAAAATALALASPYGCLLDVSMHDVALACVRGG